MCRDADDGWVAVEIKRIGTIEAVEQLSRYLEVIRRDPALAGVPRDPRGAERQAAGRGRSARRAGSAASRSTSSSCAASASPSSRCSASDAHRERRRTCVGLVEPDEPLALVAERRRAAARERLERLEAERRLAPTPARPATSPRPSRRRGTWRPTAASWSRRRAGGSARGGSPCAGRERGAPRPRCRGTVAAPEHPRPVARAREVERGACRPRRRTPAAGAAPRSAASDARRDARPVAASARRAGPKAARYRRNRCSSPSSSVTCTGASHSAARRNRSARRRSQVPDGGTRTSSTQAPVQIVAALPGSSASISSRCHVRPASARLELPGDGVELAPARARRRRRATTADVTGRSRRRSASSRAARRCGSSSA